ncbi:MAG TPA: PLDc N-terminal domain-containing protein, partial [Longimicrobium sp.]|nr:PLDc N-terminal domain-containing protein [Longimicrobium sp.]
MSFFGWLPWYLALAMLAAQVFFAVHAVRQGKAWWLFILFFFPGVGVLVYFFAEYLPDMRSGGLRSAGRKLARRLNPAAEVKRLEDEVALSNTVNNRLALADAYLLAARAGDAVAVVRSCLQGIHEDD